jgi:hypothetical protein
MKVAWTKRWITIFQTSFIIIYQFLLLLLCIMISVTYIIMMENLVDL